MKKNRVLIVDDEIDLCEIIQFNLRNAGFDVDIANSGEEALGKNLCDYDLFLFDIMMSGISGFDLFKEIRLKRNILTPVIFISALTNEDNVLEGFKLGADDYIKKPFSVKEIVARVIALVERVANKTSPVQLMPGLNVYTMKKRIVVNNQPVEFTRTEYEIFTMLYFSPGKVFARDEILNQVWTDQADILGRTVDVNITRIRKKLGLWGKCIVTRSGYGYYFDSNTFERVDSELKAV